MLFYIKIKSYQQSSKFKEAVYPNSNFKKLKYCRYI